MPLFLDWYINLALFSSTGSSNFSTYSGIQGSLPGPAGGNVVGGSIPEQFLELENVIIVQLNKNIPDVKEGEGGRGNIGLSLEQRGPS